MCEDGEDKFYKIQTQTNRQLLQTRVGELFTNKLPVLFSTQMDKFQTNFSR